MEQVSFFWEFQPSDLLGGLHFQVEKWLHKTDLTVSFKCIFLHLKANVLDSNISQFLPQGRILRTAFCLFHSLGQRNAELGQHAGRAEATSESSSLLALVARPPNVRCVHVQSCSCPTLCDPTDSSLPGSSVHGIFLARILKCVATPPPGDLPKPGVKPVSLVSPAWADGVLTTSTTWEALCGTWDNVTADCV